MAGLDTTACYVIGVVLVATLVRSTVGFGEALVGVPLLALRLPITVAAPIAVAVSVIIAGLIVVQDWREIERASATWLIVSSMLGIPLGLMLLTLGSDAVVRMILGLVIAGFSIYSLSSASRRFVRSNDRRWLLCAGFCSGVLGGAYGMNGPPLAIYGTLRRWSPQQFRATLQAYFLLASMAGLIGYVAVGLWSRELTRYLLLSLPGVCVGVLVGRMFNRRLRGERFFNVVYAALVAIGAVLVAQAVRA